jgi:hypothetical protein
MDRLGASRLGWPLSEENWKKAAALPACAIAFRILGDLTHGDQAVKKEVKI